MEEWRKGKEGKQVPCGPPPPPPHPHPRCRTRQPATTHTLHHTPPHCTAPRRAMPLPSHTTHTAPAAPHTCPTQPTTLPTQEQYKTKNAGSVGLGSAVTGLLVAPLPAHCLHLCGTALYTARRANSATLFHITHAGDAQHTARAHAYARRTPPASRTATTRTTLLRDTPAWRTILHPHTAHAPYTLCLFTTPPVHIPLRYWHGAFPDGNAGATRFTPLHSFADGRLLGLYLPTAAAVISLLWRTINLLFCCSGYSRHRAKRNTRCAHFSCPIPPGCSSCTYTPACLLLLAAHLPAPSPPPPRAPASSRRTRATRCRRARLLPLPRYAPHLPVPALPRHAHTPACHTTTTTLRLHR